ncbi:MAG: P-loop NTPase [Clostridia bacterium]|nr:P-loop NTPase [Clostridia bacterium]
MNVRIVTASGKGGAGKSTITAFLAHALANAGKKVLLIDADASLPSLDVLLGLREQVLWNWADVMEERIDIYSALVHSGDIDLLPAPGAPVEGGSIAKLIEPIEDDYDFIFADAPAGLGEGLFRAAECADRALIVTTSDTLGVRAAFRTAECLEQRGIRQSRLIVNRFRKKETAKGILADIDSIIDDSAVRLIGIVPEDFALSLAAIAGDPIKENSVSAQAFDRIAHRLLGENVPLNFKGMK